MKAIVLAGLILLTLICLLLLWSSYDWNQTRSRSPFNHSPVNLAMTFAHADHAQQQCVKCHHNYQDGTGQGLCLECHRSNPKIAYRMREQFHGLCMGCHLEKNSEGEHGGPLRSCRACHTVDQLP
ncbi:MAG: hypothetical protein ACI9LY_002335 [Arenicella sp.]|jgi:hypothetical protein